MTKVRQDFFTGTLAADLTVGGTVLSSAALASFPAVVAPDTATLVVDPFGDPEILDIVAHTALATTATLVRRSGALPHASGVPLVQAVLAEDLTVPQGFDQPNPDGGYNLIDLYSGPSDVMLTLRARVGQSGPLIVQSPAGDFNFYLSNSGHLYTNAGVGIYKDSALGDTQLAIARVDSSHGAMLVGGEFATTVATVPVDGVVTTVGAQRGLYLRPTDGGDWEVCGDVVPAATNTFDLGAAATRFRALYAGTSLQVGNTGLYTIASTTNAGDPEGSLTAGPGSLCLSENGVLHVKVTGSGNTGWMPVPPVRKSLNVQTGTTYTLAVADEFRTTELTNGSAIALTVPLNASVAIPVGAEIEIRQMGTGQVTVAGATGAVVVDARVGLKLAGQYAGAVLVKRATNTWWMSGDLTA